MRIQPRPEDRHRWSLLRQELGQARVEEGIIGPVCVSDCPDRDPNVGCHRHCPMAAVRLSSEPDRYPVEPLIAPLVFEIKRLGVFEPCWSCEGHNDSSGALWKIPRVWFYANSVVHIRALADAVANLTAGPSFAKRWHIAVTFSDDTNPDTTFSLEPQLTGTAVRLYALQNDVKKLEVDLVAEFQKSCERLSLNDA